MKVRELNARVAGVLEALVSVTTAILVIVFLWLMVVFPDRAFAQTGGWNPVELVWIAA